MIKFYKFLFYKLYRLAYAQRETVPINISFLVNVSLFELFHLALLIVLLPVKFPRMNDTLFAIIFLALGICLNYLIFLKTGYIEKLNTYFKEQEVSRRKENLIFIGYILFLFLIMLFETYLHENGIIR